MSSLTSHIEEHIKETIESEGCRLVEVEILRQGKDTFLNIYIDKDEGVDIKSCERVTKAVDPIIEELDPIQDSYFLCVSSPGLDRPLKKKAHYINAIDKEIEINLYAAVDGKKKYIGILMQYDDQAEKPYITLFFKEKDEEKNFLISEISRARPYIRF